MQIVILAGGLGTRLGPLTNRLPKSLVEIHGKPFLQYQLNWLALHGLRDVVLCVGHFADQIKAFAGDGRSFGMRIVYSIEEGELRGTAGALKKAEGVLADDFCVLNGDSYLPINPLMPIAHFGRSRLTAMMLTFHNQDRYDNSNVAVQDGLVTAYNRSYPSPGMEFIDYGMTAFRKKVLELIPRQEFANLDTVYERLIAEHSLAAYMVQEPFHEVGSVSGLARFGQYAEKEKL